MSKYKLLAKDTLIYGIGMVLQKIIGFLLLPLYTRALSPAEYGVLDTLSTMGFLITVLLSLGLDGATSRFFFIYDKEDERQQIFSTSFVLRSIFQLPIIIIACFLSPYISEILFDTKGYSWVIICSLLVIPCQTLNQLQNLIFRNYRKLWKFVLMTSVRAIIIPLFAVLFVVYYKWGVFGANLASLCSSVFMLILSYFLISRSYISYKKFNVLRAKEMLRFGFPLIFAGLISWVNAVSDRFFLLYYSDLKEIGLYSIANTFSQPILLINSMLQMSLIVLVFEFFSHEKDENKPETKKFQTNVWHFYLMISVPLAFVMSIFGIELIPFISTDEYLLSCLALPWLLLSHILVFSTDITGNGMTLKVQSKPYPIMLFVAAMVNVGLNFIFIPKWGFVGAAMTTVISNFVYFVFAYFWSQKVYYINRSFIKPVAYILFILALAILIPFLHVYEICIFPIWFRIIISFIVCAMPLFIKNNRDVLVMNINKIIHK